MFDVINRYNAVISSHEHLWQAALVLLEENCKAGQVINTNRVVEVDLARKQTMRIVPRSLSGIDSVIGQQERWEVGKVLAGKILSQ